jgi:hypothetical protein
MCRKWLGISSVILSIICCSCLGQASTKIETIAKIHSIVGDVLIQTSLGGDNIRFKCSGAEYTLSQAVTATVTDGSLYEYKAAGYAAASNLIPWKGYFIKAASACDLVLSK